MSIFQRMVLLIKVLVLMSLGISAAWAGSQPTQDPGAGFSASGSVSGSGLLIAATSESGDEEPDGSEGDDGSTTDEPDTGDGGADEGDSQS